jgi:hypothetical protein
MNAFGRAITGRRGFPHTHQMDSIEEFIDQRCIPVSIMSHAIRQAMSAEFERIQEHCFGISLKDGEGE